MGFKLRKSFKIAPGVRLNVSNKGISSVSVGKNGARVTMGKRGTTTTVGIPDTGLSYSNTTHRKANMAGKKRTSILTWLALIFLGIPILWAVFSSASHKNDTPTATPEVKADTAKSSDDKEEHIAFADCLDMQKKLAEGTKRHHQKVIELTKTDKMSVYKYCANEVAPMIFTCDGNKNVMSMAKTDNKGC